MIKVIENGRKTSPVSVIYLDANATEPLRPQARDAVMDAMVLVGNPSSPHGAGRQARTLLDHARRSISSLLDVHPDNCIFTSGGTEANTLAVRGLGKGRRRLVGATEHDAVRKASDDMDRVEVLPVLPDGRIDLAILEERLADRSQETLVCVMLANNETGVINPISEVSRLCRAAQAMLHVDAVQAVGRMPVSVPELGADSVALSAHKFGGLKGAGALVLAGNGPVVVPPMQAGGGQERGRRGGTQALPAIASMMAALEAALAHPVDLSTLRDRLESAVLQQGARACGADAPRLSNTSCLVLPGVRSEAQLIALDLAGFCVSAGSACSSGKVGGSHVLHAMGLDDLAGNALRVSLPWNVEARHVDEFILAYGQMAERRKAV